MQQLLQRRVPTRAACETTSARSLCAWKQRCTSQGRRRLWAAQAVAPPTPHEPQLAIAIELATSLTQYHQVATLRAEAYFEDQRSRFVESFKRQFVAQEVESLQQRTAPTSTSTGLPLCECLVAVDPDTGDNHVLGCIDIRLPSSKTGAPTAGVPAEDAQGAYILNVVVHEEHRGRGIGRALMHAAMRRAATKWAAASLYTHVEADNEVAYHLYTTCGFQEHSSEAKFSSMTTLGKLVLLRAPASATSG